MSAYISLAPFYDELTRDVPYGSFPELYERVFGEYGIAPKTVLDLACGTGTLTALMAERGYEMIGTDASEDMLAVATEKAYEGDFAYRPMFLNQSMTGLDLYGTVNAAICSLDGINYVPAEELAKVFQRLRLFIEPGGVLIFDVNTPEKLMGQDSEVFIDETENVFCVWRAEFRETINACVYGMDLFIRQGSGWLRRQEEHTEYAHSIASLERALADAGFGEIKERTADWDGQRVFISARRMPE